MTNRQYAEIGQAKFNVNIMCPHCGRKTSMTEDAYYSIGTLACPICGKLQQRVFEYVGTVGAN